MNPQSSDREVWKFLSKIYKCNILFFCFLFFKLIFIRVQLFYNVVLVSTVQQSESAIHIHISSPFWISLPFRSPQSTEQSSLRYTVGSHQLSILYIVLIVYMCQSQSPNSSQPPRLSPLVSLHLFFTSVSLFLLCKQDHLYHFSRFHIYALIYGICFSLSDLLHSV